jgi:1-acyl-sn-glycerol-3-phosphate acyltransferase
MMARVIEWLMIATVRLALGAQPRGPAQPGEQGCARSSEPRIYIANHSSHLDTLLLFSTFPAPLRRRTRPVAAAEYWTAGPIRRYLIRSIFRGVLVGREGSHLNPLEPAASALRRGDSLIFFPEGTRGPGRILRPLKPGLFHLARWFPKIDIVPAWIDNSYRILPKGSAIPLPMPCSITFGPPLRLKKGQRQADFLAEVRETMEALQPK